MGDDLRWLSRYQLLREVWQGRDRLVIDPDLERLLMREDWGSVARRFPAAAAMVDELLPASSGDASVTWIVTDATRRGALAAHRGGTTVVGIDDGPSVVLEHAWRVALVELAEFVGVPRSAGSTLRVRIDPRVQTTLAVLARRVQVATSAGDSLTPPTLAVSVPVREAIDERISVDDFIDLCSAYFDDATIVGLAAPSVVSAFRFVEAGDDGDVNDDDVPVDYDASLVDGDPELFALTALSDARALPDGLALFEVPDAPSKREPAPEEPAREVRLTPDKARERLDRALAERQSAKWQVDRLEGELRRALARPVDEDEARIAVARASAPDVHRVTPDLASPTPTVARRAGVSRLTTLMRRVDRGDVSPASLRRQLVAVRRLLARANRRS